MRRVLCMTVAMTLLLSFVFVCRTPDEMQKRIKVR
jgi:hypothetical protein